jgi:hypothetical protein
MFYFLSKKAGKIVKIISAHTKSNGLISKIFKNHHLMTQSLYMYDRWKTNGNK